MSKPKILVYDIETSPIISYVWGLWDQNIGINQIKQDWHVLAWAAKWLEEPASNIKYMDQRNAKSLENDKAILKGIWKLLDEADVVVTQNGKQFDEKRLNARFILHGMKPPSSYKHVDTRQIAKKKFGFTSNSLEFMTHTLCSKYKKLKKRKFSGFDLWSGCLTGNRAAWNEMEKYNKLDVLALEELYLVMRPWDNSINYGLFNSMAKSTCSCGSTSFIKKGMVYTNKGMYQRYLCKGCGANFKAGQNQIEAKKRKQLLTRV